MAIPLEAPRAPGFFHPWNLVTLTASKRLLFFFDDFYSFGVSTVMGRQCNGHCTGIFSSMTSRSGHSVPLGDISGLQIWFNSVTGLCKVETSMLTLALCMLPIGGVNQISFLSSRRARRRRVWGTTSWSASHQCRGRWWSKSSRKPFPNTSSTRR